MQLIVSKIVQLILLYHVQLLKYSIMNFTKESGFNITLQKTTLLEICIQLVCVKTAIKISVNLCHYIIVCIKVLLPFTANETALKNL